jgi:hypothetical protein
MVIAFDARDGRRAASTCSAASNPPSASTDHHDVIRIAFA